MWLARCLDNPRWTRHGIDAGQATRPCAALPAGSVEEGFHSLTCVKVTDPKPVQKKRNETADDLSDVSGCAQLRPMGGGTR
jgi:hypothetical protein